MRGLRPRRGFIRKEDKWFLFGVVWFSAWFLVFLGLCFLG